MNNAEEFSERLLEIHWKPPNYKTGGWVHVICTDM